MPKSDHSDEHIHTYTVGEVRPLNGQVTLVEYDPQWPDAYALEAKKIREALGEAALQVEHTGSTSVPGLVAKPVIDILLVLADSSDETAFVPPLETAGYILRIREPEWFEHRMFNAAGRSVNLHVFSSGCEEIARMLRFRDWLRANQADRDLYARTKKDLARNHWKHVQNYADAKTAVIAQILARASAP